MSAACISVDLLQNGAVHKVHIVDAGGLRIDITHLVKGVQITTGSSGMTTTEAQLFQVSPRDGSKGGAA